MEDKIQAPKSIEVTEEVFSSIASICASEIEGVECQSESLMGGVAKLLRPGAQGKGVHVTVDEGGRSVTVEIAVSVAEGQSIPTAAASLQNAIKETVEKMTNYEVSSVNVRVSAVKWESAAPEEEPAEEKKEEKE